MIAFRLREILEAKGWTAYRLALAANISVPTAYRLKHRKYIKRIDSSTLGRLCEALSVQPGDLLRWESRAKSTVRKESV